MIQDMLAQNNADSDGNPSGGFVEAVGLRINWQNGPLGRGDDRQEPNGAFVETVLLAAKQRLEFYQTASDGKFACDENQDAMMYIQSALTELNYRTRRREDRQVEGTHEA